MKKDGLYIASMEDNLAVKVIAIIQRGSRKDFMTTFVPGTRVVINVSFRAGLLLIRKILCGGKLK